MSRVINRSSPTTFNVPTNSRTTVMFDQPGRTRVYCNDLTRRNRQGAVSEDQNHSWWSNFPLSVSDQQKAKG